MSPAKRRASDGECQMETNNTQGFTINRLGTALLKNTGKDRLDYR